MIDGFRDGRSDNSIGIAELTMTGELASNYTEKERAEVGNPNFLSWVRGGSTENVENAEPSWLILLRRFDAAKCLSPPDCIQPRSVRARPTVCTRV